MTLVAGAALGTTDDPSALVVGSVESVQAVARRLSELATDIEDRRTALSRVRASSWTGVAADAWESRMDEELKRFAKLVDMLEVSATAFTGYASALQSAQDRAREAIEAWDRGEEATEQARQSFNQDVDAYNTAVTSGGPLPPHPGVFIDPGQPQRDDAEQILADAREALDRAGDDAVRSLGGLPGSRTEGSSDGPGAEGEVSGPTFNWDAFARAFGDRRTGDYQDSQDHGDKTLNFGRVGGSAWLYRSQSMREDYVFGGRARSEQELRIASADGAAGGGLTPEGLRLNADGTLTILGTRGSFRHEWEHGHYGMSAESSAEVSAEAHTNVGMSGVHVGGEVFGGERHAAEAEGGLFGITLRGTGERWDGSGIGAHGMIGYHDGVFRLGGAGGIGWGLGGKLGVDLEVDVPELTDSIVGGASALADLLTP